MTAAARTPSAARRLRQGSRRERDAAMALLISAVGGRHVRDTQTALEAVWPDTVIGLADYHGVAGYLYELLRDLPSIPADILEPLRRRYVASVKRHMLAVTTLRSVAATLGDAGIPWVTVKGPILAGSLYRQPGLRPYHDIDVLVHPAAFGPAVRALGDSGAELQDRNWRMLRRDLRGEVLFMPPTGIPIDLHWNLINMYRRRMHLDSHELIARARYLEVGGAGKVPSLDAEDTMLHLGLHAALSGADRLLWLKDLDLAVETWQPCWDVVVERARRSRIGPAVGLLLARSRDVLGTPVPEHVVQSLLGPVASRLASLVDRASPWAYGMGRVAAPTRLFARGIGHGVVGGAAWVAWRAVRNLDPKQEWRSSAFRERGSSRDWSEFVSTVEEIGRNSISATEGLDGNRRG